jgi:hypothetical protein
MEDYLMSPIRSLLAAGGLTILVIATVLIAGAQRGAFGLSSKPTATVLPTESASASGATSGTDTAIGSVLLAQQDEDEDEEDDDHQPARHSRSDERSRNRTSVRDHDDDD